ARLSSHRLPPAPSSPSHSPIILETNHEHSNHEHPNHYQEATMNNRREFLAAGSALAAAMAVLPEAKADSQRAVSLYIHGMVWNRQLPVPMNDWLIRLDAKVDAALGNGPAPPNPGFATLGDDFHDPVGSHVTLNSAVLKGDQLTILGSITESKNASLV